MFQKTILEDVRPGLVIAGAVLLFGICLGISFGVIEDSIKDYVTAGVSAHPELHAADGAAKEKIWRWIQRAHFHAIGIGAFTMGMIAVTALSGLAPRTKTLVSILIGAGGLYSTSWLLMAVLALDTGRAAAHHAALVQLIVFLSVGSLLLGMGILFSNIIFGRFTEKEMAGE